MPNVGLILEEYWSYKHRNRQLDESFCNFSERFSQACFNHNVPTSFLLSLNPWQNLISLTVYLLCFNKGDRQVINTICFLYTVKASNCLKWSCIALLEENMSWIIKQWREIAKKKKKSSYGDILWSWGEPILSLRVTVNSHSSVITWDSLGRKSRGRCSSILQCTAGGMKCCPPLCVVE